MKSSNVRLFLRLTKKTKHVRQSFCRVSTCFFLLVALAYFANIEGDLTFRQSIRNLGKNALIGCPLHSLRMASSNQLDEKKLRDGLTSIIRRIKSTQIEGSTHSESNQKFKPTSKTGEDLATTLSKDLKDLLGSLDAQHRKYFLDLFRDYSYDYAGAAFKQTMASAAFEQMASDLSAICDSFDAFQAAFFGELPPVKAFVDNYPKYKDETGFWNTTLLYSASRNNHMNIVKYLVEQARCSVNVQNENHYEGLTKDFEFGATSRSTALHAACFYGHLDVVKYLVEHGGDYFIKNDALETPVENGLSNKNIRDFFEGFLLFSYSNCHQGPIYTCSTILDVNQLISDSVWEYKSLNGDQWIRFEEQQSNRLQQSFVLHPDETFSQEVALTIENESYSASLVQFCSFPTSFQPNREPLWIRCRGSSILNFNLLVKWQFMLYRHPSVKSSKLASLKVFQLDDNTPKEHFPLRLNHWYNTGDSFNKQLDGAINYRRKHIELPLPLIGDESFQFDLKKFSFANPSKTISGFIRWIPLFVSVDKRALVDNFQALTGVRIEPFLRTSPISDCTSTSNLGNGAQLTETDDSEREKPLVNVRYGDLAEEKSDAIVVCWSSKNLLEMIYERGGPSIRQAVNNHLQKKLKAGLTSVSCDGDIQSTKIYFVDLEMQSENDAMKRSLEDLVSLSMRQARNENCRTIAFPAIGCGDYQFPADFIAQTMINKAARHDIYRSFEKETARSIGSTANQSVSRTIEKSLIAVEKGDLTKQKVDVIVVGSSSDILRQIVIIEGGEEVYQAYERENESNPNNLLISTPPGNLLCKRIFFVKWSPDGNEIVLRQSIVDFVWNVVQNVISNKFDTVAFGPIGCSHQDLSSSFIIRTLISQLVEQIKKRKLDLRFKFVVLPDQDQIYEELVRQLRHCELEGEQNTEDKVPSTWQLVASNSLRCLVDSKLDEYRKVADEFYRSMQGNIKKLIRIDRIQNERWYLQYLAHKKDFFRRLNQDTERRLYHGCPPKVADSIISDGFNRSFAGVHGTAFGIGVYFSSNASYSHQFAKASSSGERTMFVALVLIGNTTLGNPSMKTRPPGFDTTTDGNHIFVTYHDAQAYAEYLITYR